MVKGFADELAEERIEAGEIINGMREHLPLLNEIGATIFDRWAALLDPAR